MAARGIRINASTGSYAGWLGSNFYTPNGDDLAIMLWVRIKGEAPSNIGGEGHLVFTIPADAATAWHSAARFQCKSPDSASGSPYTLQTETTSGIADGVVAVGSNHATDEDWFVCLVRDGTGHDATSYYAKDGDAGLTSASNGNVSLGGGVQFDGIFFGGAPQTLSWGSYLEITCAKIFLKSGSGLYSSMTASSGARVLAEMKSNSVVDATDLFEYWSLNNNTDLTGSQGHTLTITGTVDSGTMDPVDIQGGSSSNCTFYGRLIA